MSEHVFVSTINDVWVSYVSLWIILRPINFKPAGQLNIVERKLAILLLKCYEINDIIYEKSVECLKRVLMSALKV